jgi:hypothetical protein
VAGRRVAQEDPGGLATLLSFTEGGSWQLARSRLAALLGVPPESAVVPLAAGWLLGQLFDPQPATVRARTAALVVAAAREESRLGPAVAVGQVEAPAPGDVLPPGTD